MEGHLFYTYVASLQAPSSLISPSMENCTGRDGGLDGITPRTLTLLCFERRNKKSLYVCVLSVACQNQPAWPTALVSSSIHSQEWVHPSTDHRAVCFESAQGSEVQLKNKSIYFYSAPFLLLDTLSSQAIIYIRSEGMMNPCEFAYVKYMHSNTRGRCCTFFKFPLTGRELSFYGLFSIFSIYSALFIFEKKKNQIPQHPNLHVTHICWVVFKITTSFVGAHRLSHGAYKSRGWSAHY